MPTINATITLNVVVKIDEGADIGSLLLRETEWLGEPKTASGCIIAVNPKSYTLNGKTDLPLEPPVTPEVSFLPIVKAVRFGPEKAWNKKYKQIKEGLGRTDLDCLFMVQYKDGAINFNVKLPDLSGQFVCIVAKDGQLESINV